MFYPVIAEPIANNTIRVTVPAFPQIEVFHTDALIALARAHGQMLAIVEATLGDGGKIPLGDYAPMVPRLFINLPAEIWNRAVRSRQVSDVRGA